MGNCTGYCMTDGGVPDAKRKITMEHKEAEGQNVAYFNEQRQEFEIEYGANPGKGDNQSYGFTKGVH